MPLPSTFGAKYGPWAVVTGASSGIGEEYTRQLAATGISIVLVARRHHRMEILAKELEEHYPVSTRIIQADLSTEEGCNAVIDQTKDLDLGLLVNCAGIEQMGSFFRDGMKQHETLIAVNVVATTRLTHAIGRRMADKGRGGILFISSLLASPTPYFTTYSASKAFVSTLSVVLKEELEPKGVTVTVVEPGAVKTDMNARAVQAVDFDNVGFKAQPVEECVAEGLRALNNGDAKVITGFMNKVTSVFLGLLPESMRMGMLKGSLDKNLKQEYREY